MPDTPDQDTHPRFMLLEPCIRRQRMRMYLILMACVSLLTGCGGPKEIPLGFLGVITGKLGDLGISGRDGAELAVQVLNDHGGIGGRAVRLLVQDNEMNARICREKARLLIENGIEGLIGPMTSDMTLACVDLFNAGRIPMISPTASTPKLSDIDDYFLRVNPSDESEGRELARFADESLQSQRVAVVYDSQNSSFTIGVYEKFTQSLQKRREAHVSAFSFLSSEPSALGVLVDELLSTGPDTILIVASAIDTGTICQQLRKAGSTVHILATGWAMTDELVKQGGESVNGVVFNHYHNNNSSAPRYRDFVDRFEKRYQRSPDFISVLSYNAVDVWSLAYASRKKGQSVKDRIIEIGTFQGLQGDIEINAFGDAFLERHDIIIRNGGFVDL